MDKLDSEYRSPGFCCAVVFGLILIAIVLAKSMDGSTPASSHPSVYVTATYTTNKVISSSDSSTTPHPPIELVEPTISLEATIFPTASSETLREREEIVYYFLRDIVEDNTYDDEDHVLDDYIDELDISVSIDALSFTTTIMPDDPDEFLSLAWDVLIAGSFISIKDSFGDWNLEKIELTCYGPMESYVNAYVADHETIKKIAFGEISLSEVIEVDVNIPEENKAPASIAIVEPTFIYSQPTSKSVDIPYQQTICECSYNAYDCRNFISQGSAQACYQFCLAAVGYDVHVLDADADGIACEWNP